MLYKAITSFIKKVFYHYFMNLKVLYYFIIGFPTWLWSCFNAGHVIEAPKSTLFMNGSKDLYHLTAVNIEGETVSLSKYKGKKLIIINVASHCGYTPQYSDWQEYYIKNKEKVEILGFPCNQFLGQEPGTAKEIATFCTKNYGVTFPLFEKSDVKGKNQNPVYKWLTDPTQNGWNSEVPSWNFCKYVVDENGKLTHFFGSKIKPTDQDFIKAMQ